MYKILSDFVATINNDQKHFPPALPPGGQANELSLMTDSTPQIYSNTKVYRTVK
jgi:hypothetical protein